MHHRSAISRPSRAALGIVCAALALGCQTNGIEGNESVGRGRPLLRTDRVVVAGPTITTKAPAAQTHFEAGLRSYYEGNREGASSLFRTAADSDPGCAMCFWGIALSNAPVPGAPADPEKTETARRAISQAQGLVTVIRPPERAYIEAVALRLTPAGGNDAGTRYKAYARAMQALAAQYPGDHDAVVLAAEAALLVPMAETPASAGKGVSAGPSDLASAGDAGAALRQVLAENPNHPGAQRLFHSSVQRTILVKWHAAMMAGQEAEAMAASREIEKILTDDAMRENPDLQGAAPAKLFTLARFGRWEKILAEPAPANDQEYLVGMWFYTRGLAFARRAQYLEVPPEQAELQEAADRVTPDQTVLGNQNAKALLKLASLVLEAEIEHMRAHRESALKHAQEAVKLEDSLGNPKPSAWYVPTRQIYGALLLWNDRPRDAEKVFREDLERNPENGWSLLGLSQSLQAQKRVSEAAEAKARAQAAFTQADVKPPTSVF